MLEPMQIKYLLCECRVFALSITTMRDDDKKIKQEKYAVAYVTHYLRVEELFFLKNKTANKQILKR